MLTRFLQLLTIWSNAELALLKICLVCAGICIGIYFYEYLETYLVYFFAAYAITAVWSLLLWIRKLKQQR